MGRNNSLRHSLWLIMESNESSMIEHGLWRAAESTNYRYPRLPTGGPAEP
jgi:hypothetical protein